MHKCILLLFLVFSTPLSYGDEKAPHAEASADSIEARIAPLANAHHELNRCLADVYWVTEDIQKNIEPEQGVGFEWHLDKQGVIQGIADAHARATQCDARAVSSMALAVEVLKDAKIDLDGEEITVPEYLRLKHHALESLTVFSNTHKTLTALEEGLSERLVLIAEGLL
jgi:hypothetical protein